jgi:hypothetical protein
MDIPTAELQDCPEEIPEASLPHPISYYTRRIPPAQDCEPEKQITIEPVYLGRGGWRKSGTILSDLRRIDPHLKVIFFFAILTAIMFFFYQWRYKNVLISSLYTTSSVGMIALAMSAAFGIDFFTAIGAAFIPH